MGNVTKAPTITACQPQKVKAARRSEISLAWLVRCTTISLQLEEAAPTENRECAEIKRYLDTNYREDISLDLLAELAHLNKYYLAHTFQREYGISPITYLNRRRIEESKHMLGNTSYSLAQISELMGFSSPSYFSQCFRKAEGMTPNEYRRQTRQGKRPAPTKRHEVYRKRGIYDDIRYPFSAPVCCKCL